MLRRRVDRLTETGAILDIDQLAAVLREQIGDYTFAEAHRISGIDIAIAVSATNRAQKPLLLSRVSHPDVLLWY